MKMLSGMCAKVVLLVALGASAVGCSVKPIPDDVTGGMSTVAIVSRIRCEVQDSILDLLLEDLDNQRDVRSTSMAAAIRRDRNNISLLKDYRSLPVDQRKRFDRFDDTVIVLDFQLRMTESNNIGGNSTLARPFMSGSDLIGLRLANNRSRENFRTFRVTTDIREIFEDQCLQQGVKIANYQYPISGEIGLKESFRTYFTLAFTNKLGSFKDSVGESPFVDTIRFTTDVSGGVDPSFSLTPSGRGFAFQDAKGMFGAGRKDEHQLTLGMSLPVAAVADPPRAVAVVESRRAATVVEASRAKVGSPSRSTLTKKIVNDAVNDSINQNKLFGLDRINPFGPLNR